MLLNWAESYNLSHYVNINLHWLSLVNLEFLSPTFSLLVRTIDFGLFKNKRWIYIIYINIQCESVETHTTIYINVKLYSSFLQSVFLIFFPTSDSFCIPKLFHRFVSVAIAYFFYLYPFHSSWCMTPFEPEITQLLLRILF